MRDQVAGCRRKGIENSDSINSELFLDYLKKRRTLFHGVSCQAQNGLFLESIRNKLLFN